MKILKYVFLVVVILGKYQVVVGMSMPKKIKRQKSTEIDPAELPHIQKHNRESIGIIDEILSKRPLEKKDIDDVDFKFARMNGNTPLKSKQAIAKKHIEKLQAEACPDKNMGAVEKNNKIFDAYSSPIKSMLVSTFVGLLSSPEVRCYSAVDTDHVTQVTPIYSADGKRLINIHGGHSFAEYLNKKLIVERDLLLIASDCKTVGFNFGNGIDKTLYVGLTASVVVDNLQLGTTIARSFDEKRFKVSLIGDDCYVGSYQDPDNQSLYRTIFPLFVVNEKNKNESGDIYLGTFARLNSETVNENHSLDLYNEQKLFISSSDFQNAMKHGKKYESKFQDVTLTKITDELNIIFAQNLAYVGLTAFPVSIYGIIDNREIK